MVPTPKIEKYNRNEQNNKHHGSGYIENVIKAIQVMNYAIVVNRVDEPARQIVFQWRARDFVEQIEVHRHRNGKEQKKRRSERNCGLPSNSACQHFDNPDSPSYPRRSDVRKWRQ